MAPGRVTTTVHPIPGFGAFTSAMGSVHTFETTSYVALEDGELGEVDMREDGDGEGEDDDGDDDEDDVEGVVVDGRFVTTT